MPGRPGRRPRRRPLRRSPTRHITRPAAGAWPKRGLRRRGETGLDGDSSVRPDQSPGFGKCRPPKRDRHSFAKVSYATLQDMTCEYLRDCLTLARAPDSSAIKWQLFAFVPDFRNFGFTKSRGVGNRKTKYWLPRLDSNHE